MFPLIVPAIFVTVTRNQGNINSLVIKGSAFEDTREEGIGHK